MRRRSGALLGMTLGLAGGVAAAQDLPGTSGFLTLDRVDDLTRFGVQLGFGTFDEVDASDAMTVRTNLYGQWAAPTGPYGLHGQLAFAHLFIDEDLGDDESAVGGIELGGYFRGGTGTAR